MTQKVNFKEIISSVTLSMTKLALTKKLYTIYFFSEFFKYTTIKLFSDDCYDSQLPQASLTHIFHIIVISCFNKSLSRHEVDFVILYNFKY